jgi:hypothetical protein
MYLWYDEVSSPIGTIVLAGRNGVLADRPLGAWQGPSLNNPKPEDFK